MEENQKTDYRKKIEDKRNAVVDRLLEQMEKHSVEWEQGWVSLGGGSPKNAVSNKCYRGINMLLLYFESLEKSYQDSRWVTFNQANDLGTKVKAGETAMPVFFYSRYDKNTKKDFNEQTVEGMTIAEEKEYLEKNVRSVLKYYSVFNSEQCVNMPVVKKELEKLTAEELAKKSEKIEKIIANSAAPVNYDGKNEAYYKLTTDSIHLPEIEMFKTKDDYYATALHEIAHSTRHSTRLNREKKTMDEVAIEELRAELSSVFLQAELGIEISGKHFSNHAAYLKDWWGAVKENKEIFFEAVNDSNKISTYIVENYLEKAVKKTQEKKDVLETRQAEQVGQAKPADKYSAIIFQPVADERIIEELKPYLNRTLDIRTAVTILESAIKRHGIENELKTSSKNSNVYLIDDRWFSLQFSILLNSNKKSIYYGNIDNTDKCGVIEKINIMESEVLNSEFYSNAEKKQARYNLENLLPAIKQALQVKPAEQAEQVGQAQPVVASKDSIVRMMTDTVALEKKVTEKSGFEGSRDILLNCVKVAAKTKVAQLAVKNNQEQSANKSINQR